MKAGDYEKFNNYCGIACVNNEVTNEDWIVVYADVFKKASYDEHLLGYAVGKGKTREEALIDAIRFFVKREEVYEAALSENDDEEKQQNIKNILHHAIEFLSSRMLTNQQEVVLPIRGWSHDCKKGYFETGEHWHATVFIDDEENAVEGHS